MGHLVEYIQSDIWVRFQKLRGHKCTFVCAADAHGTPIMITAREKKLAPEEMVVRVAAQQHEDLKAFDVDFDNFHTTHSAENQQIVCRIYEALQDAGQRVCKAPSSKRTTPPKKCFCPIDSCAAHARAARVRISMAIPAKFAEPHTRPNDLIDPVVDTLRQHARMEGVGALLFQTQRVRTATQDLDLNRQSASEHYEQTGRVVRGRHCGTGTSPATHPTSGFSSRGTTDKYFYVWLDAPVGYAASFLHLCNQDASLNFDEYWMPGHDTELYHFIGKDIVYFHSLFWPAVLQGAGFRQPDSVFAHGFLTVNGKKMSKSRGHLYQCSHLRRRTSIRTICATTTRPSSGQAWTIST